MALRCTGHSGEKFLPGTEVPLCWEEWRFRSLDFRGESPPASKPLHDRWPLHHRILKYSWTVDKCQGRGLQKTTQEKNGTCTSITELSPISTQEEWIDICGLTPYTCMFIFLEFHQNIAYLVESNVFWPITGSSTFISTSCEATTDKIVVRVCHRDSNILGTTALESDYWEGRGDRRGVDLPRVCSSGEIHGCGEEPFATGRVQGRPTASWKTKKPAGQFKSLSGLSNNANLWVRNPWFDIRWSQVLSRSREGTDLWHKIRCAVVVNWYLKLLLI